MKALVFPLCRFKSCTDGYLSKRLGLMYNLHMETPQKSFVFARGQKIEQRPGETAEQLHERLRPQVINSFVAVQEPIRIETPSWYTFDASTVLNDVPNAAAVCTSTCKHELPFRLFVGTRGQDWMQKLSEEPEKFVYTLNSLGRDLTPEEKNAIYDKM